MVSRLPCKCFEKSRSKFVRITILLFCLLYAWYSTKQHLIACTTEVRCVKSRKSKKLDHEIEMKKLYTLSEVHKVIA